MLRRLGNREFSGSLDGKKHYLDMFVVFKEDKYYFRTFNDQVIFIDIALSIIEKTTIEGEIKEIMVTILNAISSLKALYLDDFSDQVPHYNKEEYKNKIQDVIDNLFTNSKIIEEQIFVFNTEEITMEQYKIFSKEESFKEKMERRERGEKKPEPRLISYVTDTNYISVVFFQEFKDKYNNYLCGIIENKTGDFYTDLFSELITQYSTVKASMNCNIFTSPYITEEYVNVEVANAFNSLLQALCFLRNSLSFRSMELFPFDQFEIENRINMAKVFLKRAIVIEGINN